MKIRTDFVTNSSSESQAEIVIDNPVLLDILAKYKDLGTFPEDGGFTIGAFEADSDNELQEQFKTITPAFCTEIDVSSPPTSLDEVLLKIIETMDEIDVYHDEWAFEIALYEQLVDELIQRQAEIKDSFMEISWYTREDYHSGHFRYWQFKYDQSLFSNLRIFFAGTPITSVSCGTSRVTTAPAPVMLRSPILTGATSMVSLPRKTSSPTSVRFFFSPS